MIPITIFPLDLTYSRSLAPSEAEEELSADELSGAEDVVLSVLPLQATKTNPITATRAARTTAIIFLLMIDYFLSNPKGQEF